MMESQPRKKSPRAPAFALDEAMDRVLRIYEQEKRHPAPVDAAATHLGYKNAKNGASLTTMATLGYYGLLERPKDGFVAVSKDAEIYKFAPTEEQRREVLHRCLRNPPLFSDLLETYKSGLPSDATIRFDLIQRGFSQEAAQASLAAFRRSVDFARYFDNQSDESIEQPPVSDSPTGEGRSPVAQEFPSPEKPQPQVIAAAFGGGGATERVLVRLSGGRRAWLEIPTSLYSADKQRLKAQIDLLLADDEEGEDTL